MMISRRTVISAMIGTTILALCIAGIFGLIDRGVITFGHPGIPSDNETIEVLLIIDYGDGRLDKFNVSVDSGNATVYSVLMKASEENGFPVGAEYYPQYKSHYIYSINFTDQNPKTNKFWQYYINGNYGPVGVDLQKVENGDIIEWKFEGPKIGYLEGKDG